MFSMIDNSTIPQQVHIRFQLVAQRDFSAGKPDSNDDGFWPSSDPAAAGYVEPEKFEDEMTKARDRMAAWENDEWHYVGVIARAVVLIPCGGRTFQQMELDSAGVWGIESDAGDYLKEVFEEEKAELLARLDTLAAAITAKTYLS